MDLTLPYAHRGLHGKRVPENSLSAFQAAVEAGVGIELDLQLTRDGEVVVFHDTDLSRMMGKPHRIAHTGYQQLRKHGLPVTGERIPSLHHVLSLVAGRVPLLLDVKPGQRRRKVRAVAEQIEAYSGPLALQSFDPLMVGGLQARTSHEVGLVVGKYRDAGLPRRFREAMEHLWAHEAHGAPDFHAYDVRRLTWERSQALRAASPLLAWSVDSKRKLALARILSDQVIFERGLSPDEVQ